MRRNSNCCNQNRCYHNDRDFSPSDKCIASREPHGYLFMNQCDGGFTFFLFHFSSLHRRREFLKKNSIERNLF